jgi:GNAT superfamily N-acetyltransferase
MTTVRNAKPEEHAAIGQLMVNVYSALPGFPSPAAMPGYYQMLAQVGLLTEKPEAEILVAVDAEETLAGALVYFGNMSHYGTPSTATQQTRAAGFRFLAVDASFQGKGIGRQLAEACIAKAKQSGKASLIIHTTAYMQTAQRLYQHMGFIRHAPFDFTQNDIHVMALVFSLT